MTVSVIRNKNEQVKWLTMELSGFDSKQSGDC